MSEAGWAERKVDGYGLLAEETAAAFILAEHKRAVRVVKAEIKRVKLSQNEFTPTQKMRVEETLDRLLAALQRGRE